MMMFGFEVDTLEISLRSQLDWVDMVFLVEATSTTKGVGGAMAMRQLIIMIVLLIGGQASHVGEIEAFVQV